MIPKKEYKYYIGDKDGVPQYRMMPKEEAMDWVSWSIGDTYLEAYEDEGPLHFEYIPSDEYSMIYRDEIAEHFPEENVDDMIAMAGGLVRIIRKWEREFP